MPPAGKVHPSLSRRGERNTFYIRFRSWLVLSFGSGRASHRSRCIIAPFVPIRRRSENYTKYEFCLITVVELSLFSAYFVNKRRKNASLCKITPFFRPDPLRISPFFPGKFYAFSDFAHLPARIPASPAPCAEIRTGDPRTEGEDYPPVDRCKLSCTSPTPPLPPWPFPVFQQ